MSQDLSSRSRNKTSFATSYYSKADLMRIWGIFDHQQFQSFIGEEGVKILGWKAGKQKFTPKQLRALLDHVGSPVTHEEIVKTYRVLKEAPKNHDQEIIDWSKI